LFSAAVPTRCHGYLASTYLSAQIDVVEIDPGLTSIAKRWFAYDSPSNVRIVNDDARTYVDTTDERYDIVIVDIYNDNEIPFTILTREYGESIRRIVNDGGVVIANIIASDHGWCLPFFQASLKPYTDHFVYNSYLVNAPNKVKTNIVAVLSDTDISLPVSYKTAPDVKTGAEYTDDFAPSEALQFRCRQ